MNQRVSTALYSLFPSMEPPVAPELLQLTTSFHMQSVQKVKNLKPSEESARYLICGQLAAEKLMFKLNLPPIKQPKNIAIPPKAYDSLLAIFKRELIVNNASGGSGSNRTSPVKIMKPRSGASSRPTTPIRIASREFGTPIKPSPGSVFGTPVNLPASAPINALQTPGTAKVPISRRVLDEGEDSITFGSLSSTNSVSPPDSPSENALFAVPPVSQTPISFLKSAKKEPTNNVLDLRSPTKKIRGGIKPTDPRQAQIEMITRHLVFSKFAIDGVLYGYKQYFNLVKDRWGLLCGLIIVVAEYVQHPLLLKSENLFYSKLLRSVGTMFEHDRLDEWVIWVEKIVKDQMWIKALMRKSDINPTTVMLRTDTK
ncbi:hypothetical protein NADFUDRAFT_83962, partial [Nadsonia fulvescens var. elongata DSM 6958]